MQTKKLRASAVAWLLLVPIFVSLFYFGGVAAAPSPVLDETSWTNGIIYSDTDVSSNSNVNVVMDSDGYFHVSYLSENSLMYATNIGGEWKTEAVDDKHNVEKYSAIAVDSDGVVHISYFITNNSGQLCYAVGNYEDWELSVISDEYTIGKYNSIAVDDDNNVHMIFLNGLDELVVYATNAGGSWNLTTVVSYAAYGTALTIDEGGIPHAAFVGQTGEIIHAYLSSGNWETEVIDDAKALPAALDIDITDGKICVAYGGKYNELMYAVRSEIGIWSEQVVYNASSSIMGLSLNIDSSDDIHIAFCTSGHLDYAVYDGAWSISMLDNSAGSYVSIVSDYNDKQHVIYLDDEVLAFSLGYITNSWASWQIENIDDSASEDQTSSIAVDENGNAHIAYYDSYTANNTSYGRLCYANNVDGWVIEVVDNSTDSVGLYPSITLDSDGYVHISYLCTDSGSETLKYATNEAGSWHDYILDGAGNVANYSSIGVDDDGMVYVAYLSQANSLKFITFQDGDVKSLEAIDSGIVTTDQISLAINSTGIPHVAYYLDGELYHAYLENSTWTLESLESTSQLGGGLSMYIDDLDQIYIGYCDPSLSQGLLKYISNVGGNWSDSIVIDSESDLVGAIVITVNENGDEHIAYIDGTGDGILKYAEKRNGIWVYQKVDLESCGNMISMAMDSEGRSHISYFNETGSLMYATSVTIPSAPTNLTVTVHNGYLTLNWAASVNDGGMDLIEYQIYRSNGTSGYAFLDTVSASTTGYNDSDVTNGANYTYKVKAVNSEGSSLFSNAASGIPCSRPGVVDLDVDAGDGSVELSWSEPDNGGGNITSYTIYRRAEGATNYTLLATVDGNVLSYKDRAVDNGVEYSYYIIASNPAGDGPESQSVTATPNTSYDMLILIIVVVVALAAAGVAVFVLLKRKGNVR
ncbi:MAG: fibronectin type III domain-containing protein [Methanomassiliicoccales archaeon]|nr:fibronectin type III domain-containing protein [Methanomassiliicoccales archaeon]